MKRYQESSGLRCGLVVLGACFLSVIVTLSVWSGLPVRSVGAAEESNIDSTNKWAWNDVVGWIDFYHSGDGAFVTDEKLEQAAVLDTDPSNHILLDCATTPTGNICATSKFSVSNYDNGGYLAGYAWNDDYGWISFCGNATEGSSQVGDHWECPASPTYQVYIDLAGANPSGDFSGYAWNDTIGWISFSDNDPVPYRVQVDCTGDICTQEGLPGYLQSATIDTGAVNGFAVNSITWKGTLPTYTHVGFTVAVTSSSTPSESDFKGENGGTTLYETSVGAAGVYRIDIDAAYHNPYKSGYRYLKYRVYIDNAYQETGPVVEDVILNWSS